MEVEIKIPKIFKKEITIAKWNKKEKDPIKEGEIIFVIQTEKTLVDYYAAFSGTLKKILIKKRQKAKPEQTIAIVEK